jgi:hypothetical protein
MMAYLPFPNELDIKTLDTSEAYCFCSFSTADYFMEIAEARIHIYKHGALAGNEQIRVKIYRDSGLTDLLDTSAWVSLSERAAKGTYDINWLAIPFNLKVLASGTTYHAVIETQNYTRNADTFYIGLVLQSTEGWMEPPANTSIAMDAGVFQILAFRKQD